MLKLADLLSLWLCDSLWCRPVLCDSPALAWNDPAQDATDCIPIFAMASAIFSRRLAIAVA